MAKFWPDGTEVSFAGTDIGGLTSISTPEEERGEVDLTDHDSDGDWEGVPGLRNGGSLTLEGHYDPEDDGQQELRDNYEADDGSTEEVVITLPDRSADTTPVTFTFDAFVTQPPVADLPGGDSDQSAQFSATMKVTGAVTFDVAE